MDPTTLTAVRRRVLRTTVRVLTTIVVVSLLMNLAVTALSGSDRTEARHLRCAEEAGRVDTVPGSTRSSCS